MQAVAQDEAATWPHLCLELEHHPSGLYSYAPVREFPCTRIPPCRHSPWTFIPLYAYPPIRVSTRTPPSTPLAAPLNPP